MAGPKGSSLPLVSDHLAYNQIPPSWTFLILLSLKDTIYKRHSETNDADRNKRTIIFHSKPNKSTLFSSPPPPAAPFPAQGLRHIPFLQIALSQRYGLHFILLKHKYSST